VIDVKKIQINLYDNLLTINYLITAINNKNPNIMW